MIHWFVSLDNKEIIKLIKLDKIGLLLSGSHMRPESCTIELYVTVSAKTRLVRTIKFFLIAQHYFHCLRNDIPKFQTSGVSSVGIKALERRKNKKKIDLYSDYTKKKLQTLAFAAITSVWIGVQS